MSVATGTAVEQLEVFAKTIPTDAPESDGTLEWDSTTIVVVQVHAGGLSGLGYTYTHDAAARLIEDKLAPAVRGVMVERDLSPAWHEMGDLLRNVGRPGMGFMALSAVDIALWDLKARVLGVPLVDLLGGVRDEAAIYGSGGFTSYSLERLAEQLAGWVAQGIPRVKIKIGRSPDDDPERLDAARVAIGDETALFVDANGAFDREDAVAWAERYAREWGVTWFEEPVSSADLAGLRYVRRRAPLDVAAGEYAYVPADFRNLLDAGAVDCLQVDVTRCGGYTGFLHAAALAEQHGLEVSAHCAPQASAHVCCAVPHFRHIEYFHDHVRIERMLFGGALEPDGGALRPDRSRPGHGLVLR
ncbi:MAG: mandelate racemase [Actinobacteria bacterium]|nr:MAG: mandelate racemase [Actinomycetota bacterium]